MHFKNIQWEGVQEIVKEVRGNIGNYKGSHRKSKTRIQFPSRTINQSHVHRNQTFHVG